jgi:hypothetical protein
LHQHLRLRCVEFTYHRFCSAAVGRKVDGNTRRREGLGGMCGSRSHAHKEHKKPCEYTGNAKRLTRMHESSFLVVMQVVHFLV